MTLRSEHAANLALQPIDKDEERRMLLAQVKDIMALPISFRERLAMLAELDQDAKLGC